LISASQVAKIYRRHWTFFKTSFTFYTLPLKSILYCNYSMCLYPAKQIYIY
jgi:hypothetical protein